VRLLLVDNLLFESDGDFRRFELDPHLGLISLAAVARLGGHAVEIYDPKQDMSRGTLCYDAALYRELAARIASRQPEIVGFTALGCNLHCVARTASLLRQLRPDLPILIGGPQATILHREVLERFAAFDVVVRSEAEETLLPLLDALARDRLDRVPGITYRAPNGEIHCNEGNPIIENLDRLPFAAYDCYPIAELGLTQISLEAGRGCPFSCTFCSTASFFGRQYRLKSPARLVAEMDRLHAVYGFDDFGLNHDLFTVSRKKVLAFCEAVRSTGYKWSCSARVDCVDPELLTAMAEAGCTSIYFGIEAGAARMQEISRKRLDLALVEPAITLCDRLGIATTASFITGFPEEESSDQAETLDMAGRLFLHPGGRTHAQLHLLTPEPGTGLLAQHGTALRFDGHATDHNLPILDDEDAALLAGDAVLFSPHHFFPTVLPRSRHVFVTAAGVALVALGRDVLRYVVGAFDGRLGVLVDAMDDWRREASWPAAADPDFVVAFLAARFGAGHHLVSLCRYAYAMRAARLAAERGLPPAPPAPGRTVPLVLAQHVAVLADIHHPKRLAALLGETYGERVEGPRVSIVVKPDPATRQAATFVIDRATAQLLRRFDLPRTHAQICREAAAAPPAWERVQELVADGLLSRARPQQERALTPALSLA
jgi:B12 binding domain/Radical SAM superfamily